MGNITQAVYAHPILFHIARQHADKDEAQVQLIAPLTVRRNLYLCREPHAGAKVPVRIKIKNIAMAQSQEFLVLLWGHSGLTWQPDQLVLTCLGR